jgi:polyhydroxybutyrate depolymerase
VAACSAAPATAAPLSTACSTAPVAGSHARELTVGGVKRFMVVHVPAGIPVGRPAALVLALHGFGGSGPEMERYSGFSRVADQHGFIVAYPSADGLLWNVDAEAGLPNDVAFLSALIASLERRMCVDPQRVFATGVSNGGGMVALAGCELSTQIGAIAPVAGGYDGQPACRPTRPVSVLEIHGTSDPVVPYFGKSRRPTADGLPPFVNGWVDRDGCSLVASARRLAVRTTLYRWSGCASEVQVEHIRILRGRHQWPGARPADPGPPSTICAACTIWGFFSSLRSGPRMWSASGGADLGTKR